MEHSNGSVMHASIQACFLYFFYNPYNYMSLFNYFHLCIPASKLVFPIIFLQSLYVPFNSFIYLYICDGDELVPTYIHDAAQCVVAKSVTQASVLLHLVHHFQLICIYMT